MKKIGDIFMKKFLFIYYFLIAVSVAMGQSLTVNAPQEVSVGQKFRLTYTINTHDVSEFQIGQIPSDGFEVLMGPSVSKSSSYSINNGHATHNSSIVYTYILYALKDGIYTIPAASVKSEGKLISSNSLRIHVTGSNNGLQSQHQNKGLSSQENIQKSDARISQK